ncbi:MucBP domain-containing protein [Enterococcus sp. AZ007]|uniref:MucBP domain-containing protein n=1 Tax=Enterococcus sp. AZ007 TaxID=2774839 RepID=UPI003F27CD67
MKKGLRVFLLFVGVLFSVLIGSQAEAATKDMYRLYNPNSGEHFYTANKGERDNVKRAGWKDEGIGWYAPTSGDPVYRLYNPNAGDHHYTPHKNERDHLLKVGWKNEGIGWYSDKSKTIPLYRAYNPNAKAGSHNYTVNKSEQNNLIRVGWKNEGIAWYGAKKDSGTTPAVKKTELQTLYNKVKGTAKGSYTEATWKSFQNALKNAKSILDNGKATQTQVNSAKDTLQKAFTGLKKETKPETQKYTVAVKYLDTEKKELKKAIVTQVVKGGSYTATAPDIEGYELQGEKTKKVSNVTANQEITFTYKKKETGSGKEKVAFSGHAYSSLKQVLNSKEIVLSSKNYQAETILTEEDGYFFTHLVLGETYTLNGEDFEVTVTAKSLDDIQVNNKLGEVTTGKLLTEPGQGYLNLDQSVIYIEDVDYEVSAKLETVELSGKENLLTGDTIVLPPNEENLEGFSFRILSAKQVNGNTQLVVEPCEITDIINDVKFSDEIDLSQMTFIPAEGVTPQMERGKRSDGDFTQKYNKEISMGQSKGNISISFSGSIVPIFEFNKLMPLNSKVGLSPKITTTISADFNLKGKASTTIPVGRFFVCPMGISVSVEVSFYISAEGEVKVNYTLSNTQNIEAGIKDMQIYHDMKPSKTKESFSVDGKLSLKAAPQVTAGFGAFGADAFKLNAQGGVDAGVTANYQSERNRIHFTGKAHLYVYAGFSMPIFSILPNDWSDEREIFQQRFPFTDDIDFELPIDPSKPIIDDDGKEDGDEEQSGEEGNKDEDNSEINEGWIPLTITNFPDKYFREDIIKNYMIIFSSDEKSPNYAYRYIYDERGNFSHYEIDSSKLNSLGVYNSLANDLTGIEHFNSLKNLDIRDSINLTDVDLRKNPILEDVDIRTSSITNLRIDNLKSLKRLLVMETPLTAIDISTNESLEKVEFFETNIETLNADRLLNLTELYCQNSKLSTLSTEGASNIQYLRVDDNSLTQLSVNHLVNLIHLTASKNQLTNVDLSNLLVLVLDTSHYTDFRENQITEVYLPRNLSSDFDSQWMINSVFHKNGEILRTHYSDKVRTYKGDGSGGYLLIED